jgi:thiol-disulfide isomerase/thioredoxin
MPIDDSTIQRARRKMLFWFLAASAIGGIWAGRMAMPPQLPPTDPRVPLAGVVLQPLTGAAEATKIASVTSDALKGRVTLLNFWGTWCPPCVAEFPDIVALEQKFRDSTEVRVLVVSCSEAAEEDVEALRKTTADFLQSHGAADLPTYVDPGLVTRRALAKTVGFREYPTTLVLDRAGVVRGYWPGPINRTEVESRIGELLATP